MTLPIILVGGGGHAKVLLDTLLEIRATLVGIVDAEPRRTGTRMLGVEIIGTDDTVVQHAPGSVLLVNGLGSVRSTTARRVLYDRFRAAGYHFATVVHPRAVVSRHATLAEGVQVMAGAVIQPGAAIGENTIVNTSACVDHDCVIGAHVHIAPRATLSGSVRVGDGAHIGAGATVIQEVCVGRSGLVGAGAVVVRDVPDAGTVTGVPARAI